MSNLPKKILIANRGEIACRIIRTCDLMGIESVAVYSEAEPDALHVEMAKEAVLIGPAKAAESYLNTDAVIGAARETGADALHPGYGFLSENSDFARRVVAEGLQWIGPSPDSIDQMGDKERAREIASQAGVPVLPASRRFKEGDDSNLHTEAEKVGYPLLVKAAAGGGGIGMRRVDDPSELVSVVQGTQSMAGKAFGDSGIYLERFVETARHIEVQVFGFGDGRGVHLFDRDCSIQRRFQKIIEEAPAPGVPEGIREHLYHTALALVALQKYSGAGTVEFIYDVPRAKAYFLEMNTRIQVEHPASEMVTGIDLIDWQIRQAAGVMPAIAQEEVCLDGHAIECRLCAERPQKNFLPAPGEIGQLSWPTATDGLRIEPGVSAGGRVLPYYDPLFAKLIAHGSNRLQAVERLVRALDEMQIQKLSTNASFIRSVLDDPAFREGNLSTDYVTEFLPRWKEAQRQAG
ncbi:MAG: acetyl-CoA carboxylase biotin carboxylase subunit [Pseudomonadota bacterium]